MNENLYSVKPCRSFLGFDFDKVFCENIHQIEK